MRRQTAACESGNKDCSETDYLQRTSFRAHSGTASLPTHTTVLPLPDMKTALYMPVSIRRCLSFCAARTRRPGSERVRG